MTRWCTPGHGPETTIGREQATNPFVLGTGSKEGRRFIMILAAVDDLMFSSRISTAAKAVGATIRFTRSVEAVIDAARETRPALVILDLNSARTQPLEILAALKAIPCWRQSRPLVSCRMSTPPRSKRPARPARTACSHARHSSSSCRNSSRRPGRQPSGPQDLRTSGPQNPSAPRPQDLRTPRPQDSSEPQPVPHVDAKSRRVHAPADAAVIGVGEVLEVHQDLVRSAAERRRARPGRRSHPPA